MKPISLLLLALVLSGSLKAQDNNSATKKSKHELNISLEGLFNKSQNTLYTSNYLSSSYLPSSYYITGSNPFIGIGYKYHFPSSALRIKVIANTEHNNQSDSQNKNTNKQSSFSAYTKIGFELHQKTSKTCFFYGIDAFTHISKTEHKTYASSYNSFYTKRYNGYGLAPFFGIRYFITPQLSLSTELSYQLESFKEEQSNKQDYLSYQDEGTNSNSGFKSLFSPLGQLSVNVHF